MKLSNVLFIIFVLSTINSYSISKDGDCNFASDYDCWISMIYSNEIDKIRNAAVKLASDTTFARNHAFEVKLVHLAIDCLNPEALLALYENNLGLFDPEIDDITPFDYLFNGNLDERISSAKDNPLSSEENLVERFYWTSWILLGFQEINFDESKILEIRTKLEKYIESSK